MSGLSEQFEKPTGLLGWLAGKIMVRSNQELNRWVINLLKIKNRDHVLEIGFGPGLAIQEAAKQAISGWVVGIDPSKVMLKEAMKRNAVTIGSKRVELKKGEASNIPYDHGIFDKVYAINTIQLWEDMQGGLDEAYRVLKNGGKIAIASQPKWVKTEKEVKDYNEKIIKAMQAVGFQELQSERLNLEPVSAFCVIGTKIVN